MTVEVIQGVRMELNAFKTREDDEVARYTVGKLAQTVNVSSDTVRLYEKLGLLPKAMRGENRYRYFSEDSVQRIQLIRKFQNIGFTLEEIAGLLDLLHNAPLICPEVKEALEQKNFHLEKQIRELISLSSLLKKFIARCSHQKLKTDCPVIVEFHAGNRREQARKKAVEKHEQPWTQSPIQCAHLANRNHMTVQELVWSNRETAF